MAASGFAFSQRAAAVRQRDQAIYNQVVAEALQFGTSDTTLAAQLNLAAYRIQPTQDLASRLLNTENTPLPSPLAAGAGFVYSVAFSPDGHTLASGNADGTIRLWDVADPAHPRPLGQPLTSGPGDARAARRRPIGGVQPRRAHAGQRRQQRHDPAVGRRRSRAPPACSARSVIAGGFGAIHSVAFSPDGHTLASGNA